MLSAPATIPATSAGTFRAALTPPAAFRVSLPATRSPSPHRRANAIVGARPAHEIRFGSSKTAATL